MVDYETATYVTGIIGGILTIADALTGIWIPAYITSFMSLIPFASLFSGLIFSFDAIITALIPIALGFISFIGCSFLSNGKSRRAAAIFLIIGIILLTLSVLALWIPLAGSLFGGVALIFAGIMAYRL
ncbi:MAG: hypothetical protein ACUVXA_06930 [Candidatus Jordarchaeum sp.]|uniref:hypothetical protein n=1 Tax=Candidatus Jordarchaeum sp. TaxID=2823881 RepID=UPI00404B8D62